MKPTRRAILAALGASPIIAAHVPPGPASTLESNGWEPQCEAHPTANYLYIARKRTQAIRAATGEVVDIEPGWMVSGNQWIIAGLLFDAMMEAANATH